MNKLLIIPILILASLIGANAAFATTTDISTPTNGSTNTSKPVTFTGNTVTEGHINLQEDGTTIASTTADVNGDWFITTSNVKNGTHNYTAVWVEPDYNLAFMNGQAEGTIEVVDVNNHEFVDTIVLPDGAFSNDLVVRNSTLYVQITENSYSLFSIECSILEYSLPDLTLTRQISTGGDCNVGSIDVNPDETIAVVSYLDYSFTSFHIIAVDLDSNTIIDDLDTEFTVSDGIVFSKDAQSFFFRIGGGVAKFHLENNSIEADDAQGYNQDFSPAIAVDPVSGNIAIAEVETEGIRLINPNDLDDTTLIHVADNATTFTRLAYSHDGSKIMLVGQNTDGNYVWEIDTNTELVSNEYALTDYPESVGYTPDDSQYVIGDNFGSGTIFFGVPGGSNYTDSIVEPQRAYAMRNSNFIAAFPDGDVSETVSITNNIAFTSYGTDPAGNISTKTVSPGGTVDVSGSGYLPNSDVTITLNSTPVLLATVKTNSSGAFSTTVTIPSNTALGSHTLVIAGKDANGDDVNFVLQLNVVRLPATGNGTENQLIFAGTIFLLGCAVACASRKRRKISIN